MEMEMAMVGVPIGSSMKTGEEGKLSGKADIPAGFAALLSMMLSDKHGEATQSAPFVLADLSRSLSVRPMQAPVALEPDDTLQMMEAYADLLSSAFDQTNEQTLPEALIHLPEVKAWVQMFATWHSVPQEMKQVVKQFGELVKPLPELSPGPVLPSGRAQDQGAVPLQLSVSEAELAQVMLPEGKNKHLVDRHEWIRLNGEKVTHAPAQASAGSPVVPQSASHALAPWAKWTYAPHADWTLGNEAQSQSDVKKVDGDQLVKIGEPIFPMLTLGGADRAIPVDAGKHAAPTVPVHAAFWAQEFSDLVFKQLKFVQTDGQTTAKLSLIPEHLGHVAVKLTIENGHLNAQFAASTVMGKELLETQLNQLRVALQNQGLQVDKLVVSQHDSASGFFMDARGQQFSQQFGRSQEGRTGRYEDADEFLPIAEQSADRKWLRGGSSFEATA